MQVQKLIIYLVVMMMLNACVNKKAELDSLFTEDDLKVETAKDVEIFYSDSASVKIIIRSPLMKRYVDNMQPNDEFPAGIHVTFLDQAQKPSSWLEAKYAIRSNKDRKIYVRDSVLFYNADNDKLTTSELIWDEGAGEIYTDKFVRISQPSKRDTSYGYGFRANENLSRFEILNFQAVKNAETLKESFDK